MISAAACLRSPTWQVLPIDFLKIDGKFIRNLNTDPIDFAMVEPFTASGVR